MNAPGPLPTRPPVVRVMSVYGPSPWNRDWMALQARFLRRTTPGFDVRFGVFLNGVDAESVGIGAGVDVIGQSATNLGHGQALQRILDQQRETSDQADRYLFLDSDCFPVHPDWITVLDHLMVTSGKRFAAPVRFENLESYPHPCALFMSAPALHDPRLAFSAAASTSNLLGEPVSDVGAGLQSISRDLLPLVRSNVRNPHPIAAAIYNHLFYHHGAGSREFRFRASDKYGYYAHWHEGLGSDQVDTLLPRLLDDPDAFIAHLTKY